MKNLFNITVLIVVISVNLAKAGTPIINNPGIIQEMDGTYNVDVTINPGNFVMIRNKVVFFDAGKKIIVKPGGVLVIKNSTVTLTGDNSTGTSLNLTNFWGGIDVQGDNTKNQDYEFNTIYCGGKLACVYNHSAGYNVHNNGENQDCFGPNPKQGVVYIEGSKLKYMEVGIRVGDVINSKTTMGLPSESTTVKSGGIVFAISTKFQNFANSAITFASYKKFYQQSVIRSCSTEIDFRTNVATQQLKGLYCNHSFFKISIESNTYITLATNTGSSLRDGIVGVQTNALINSNRFVNLLGAGIHLKNYATSMKRRTEITENYFYNVRQIGIWTINIDQLLVRTNSIYLNLTYSSSGIWCWDGNNYTLENNTVKPITNKTNSSEGIGITMHTKSPANVSFNKIYGTGELLRFQDENKLTVFRCNSFYSNAFATYEVVNVYPNGSGIGNQGSNTKPVVNYFNQGLNSSKQLNIGSGSGRMGVSNSWNYYYNNVVAAFEPKIVDSEVIKQSISSSNPTCTYLTGYKTPVDPCGRPILNYPGGTGIYKGGVIEKYNIEHARYQPPADDYIYVERAVDYDNCLNELISFFQDIGSEDSASWEENKDSILFYVLNHKSKAKYLFGIPYLIELGDNSLAQDFIDSFLEEYPNDSLDERVADFYTLLNEYSLSGYSDTWAFDHFDTLMTLGQGNGYTFGGSPVLAEYIASLDENHPNYGMTLTLDTLYEFEDSFNQNDDSVLISASPVPFDDEVVVRVTNGRASSFQGSVVIYDLNMAIIEEVETPVNAFEYDDFTINTTPYEPGFYVFILKDHDDTPLNQFIVYKY